MATAKKKPAAHKSRVSNPPRSNYLAKTNTGRKPAAKKKAASSGRSTHKPRRRTYRRNPSDIVNAALVAIGGAFTLVIFNEAVGRFAPSVTGAIRVASKAAAGWAVGAFGRKYLGTWASVVQTALWLSAASDAIDVWVKPMFPTLFTATGSLQVVGQQQVQDQSTGQAGMTYMLSSGDSFTVFPQAAQSASSYAN